jgi:hypothetical protein
MARFPARRIPKALPVHDLARFACELLIIGAIYFALRKLDLALASIHPGAMPVAPASGFALAATLLRGLYIWPAILAAALAAHASGSFFNMSIVDWISILSIGVGETLEAVIGGY